MTLRKLCPGAWAADDGTLHLDVGELLEANGYADTPANRDAVAAAARQLAIAEGLEVFEG
jgi:hypothetical protein